MQDNEKKAVDEELLREKITAKDIDSILAKKLENETKNNSSNNSENKLSNQPQATPIQNSQGKPVILSVGKDKILDESICPDCKGRGIIIEKEGLAHTCWRCLNEGRLDVHTRSMPMSKIRL